MAGVGGPAASLPTGRPLERLERVLLGGGIRRTLIERHGDVGAEVLLDLHRPFWGKDHTLTVDLITKRDPSSVISLSGSEKTWNPPESLRMGTSNPMNR